MYVMCVCTFGIACVHVLRVYVSLFGVQRVTELAKLVGPVGFTVTARR